MRVCAACMCPCYVLVVWRGGKKGYAPGVSVCIFGSNDESVRYKMCECVRVKWNCGLGRMVAMKIYNHTGTHVKAHTRTRMSVSVQTHTHAHSAHMCAGVYLPRIMWEVS